MKTNTYHYKECGLDNVYLHNVDFVMDTAQEKTVIIRKINKLHKAIAISIISKNGLIAPKEIIYLRSFLGMTQSEFADILGKDGQTVGRWERSETKQDFTTDTLIRIIVKELLNLETELNAQELSLRNRQQEKENTVIHIDGYKENYTPILNVA